MKKMAECPMCYLKFPMKKIEDHIAGCELKVVDPDIVTCKYCKGRMRRTELPDHAIAHLVHQKQVEWQIVERVADVEDFFETEALQQAGPRGVAPLLDREQMDELPLSTFKSKKQEESDKPKDADDDQNV